MSLLIGLNSSYRRDFLSSLIYKGLVTTEFAKGLYPELCPEASNQSDPYKMDVVLDQPFETLDVTPIQAGGIMPHYAKLILDAKETGMGLQVCLFGHEWLRSSNLDIG